MFNVENNLYVAFDAESDEAYQGYDPYEAYTTPAGVGLRTSVANESQAYALPVGGSGTWTTLLAVLLALVFVLFLAYYATRITGRGRRTQKTRNLRIVEVLGVNPHTTVQLIKAGDKYFVIGVSRTGVTPMGEVSADSVVMDEPNSASMENPFDKYLSRFTKKKDETLTGDD